jgi:tetratricopeptide (TPR) repeat protein
MKRKNLFVLVLCFFIVFFFTYSTQAAFFNQVKKANEFMQKAIELKQIGLDQEAGEKLEEAETVLKEELIKNTQNLEALYALGVCYFYQGNEKEADKKFTIVDKLNRSYGLKIFDFYMDEGYKLFKEQPEKYLSLVVKACHYQSARRKTIAQDLLKDGNKLLHAGYYNSAELHFHAAYQLDKSISKDISHAYFEFGKTQEKPINQIRFWRASLTYGNYCEQEIVQVAVKLLKKIGLKPVKKELDRFPKTIRITIITIAFPPDYKIYHPGTYYFNLKAGETTKQWIMFPYGRHNKYTIFSEDDQPKKIELSLNL